MPGTFTRKRNVYSMQPPNMAPSIKRRLITVATISMFVSATVIVASSYIFVLGLVNSQRSNSNNSSNQSVENIQHTIHPGPESNSTSYNNIRQARSLSEDPTSIAPVFLTSTETETTTASGLQKTSTRTASILSSTRPPTLQNRPTTEHASDFAPLDAAHRNAVKLAAESSSTPSNTAKTTEYPSTTTETASRETTFENTLGDAPGDDLSPLAAAHTNALNLAAPPSAASSTTVGKTSSPGPSSTTPESALTSSETTSDSPMSVAPGNISPLASAHENALNLAAPPSSTSLSTVGPSSKPESSTTDDSEIVSKRPSSRETPEGTAAIFNGLTEPTRPGLPPNGNKTATSESGNSSTTARPGPLTEVKNAVKNGTLFSNWSQKWQNFRSKWANSKLFVLTNSGVVLTAAFLQFVSAASISIIVKRTTAEGKVQRLASRWIVFNAIIFIILTLGLVSFAAMGSDPEKLSGSHLVIPHEPQGSSIGFLSKSLIANIYIFIILADVIGLFFLILTSSCLLRHIEPPPHHEFDVCQ